jgi:uridine phosphorylase
MNPIGSSELILTPEGTIYHLNIRPDQIAKHVILVGDPDRVAVVSAHFDQIDHKVQHREFLTHTGIYKNVPISVVSTGIGTDNIDIVVNELDALVNIDFATRIVKEEKTSLNLVRLGTSGAIQRDISVGTIMASEFSIGFDGLMHFYAGSENIREIEMEEAFISQTSWREHLARPYIVRSSNKLLKHLTFQFETGINISSPGFYGPQGRQLRLALHDQELNHKIEAFRFKNYRITNYEMESSGIYGLAGLLGHEALTICAIIANRITLDFDSNYQVNISGMIEQTLDAIVNSTEL